MPILQIRKLGLKEVQSPGQLVSGVTADVTPVFITIRVEFFNYSTCVSWSHWAFETEASLLTLGWFDLLCCL